MANSLRVDHRFLQKLFNFQLKMKSLVMMV